jgi:hypothetical protein
MEIREWNHSAAPRNHLVDNGAYFQVSLEGKIVGLVVSTHVIRGLSDGLREIVDFVVIADLFVHFFLSWTVGT